MPHNSLSVSVAEQPALVVSPELVRKAQVSYLLVANVLLRYPRGSSRIAYIGTTYTGFWRLASSTAERAKRIFRQRGVESFEVLPVRAQPRQGLRTWALLEKNLLSLFRERYGKLPRCNTRGGSYFEHFEREDLLSILKRFE